MECVIRHPVFTLNDLRGERPKIILGCANSNFLNVPALRKMAGLRETVESNRLKGTGLGLIVSC